ncbi:MAG: zinc dependent phospholipase C family protein, partial [Treponema sp.]|nr:zinc dependent phospholipase C family protein [Treponema sp.]
MPSQILHTLFGEDLFDALFSHPEPGQARNRRRQDPGPHRQEPGAFAVGCQGPDIFYHSRHTKPLALEYGSLLHRRGYGTFCAHLLGMALSAPQSAHRAYALGFLSHAALDRACHPYIIYKSAFTRGTRARGEENSLYHPFFERILDTLMLRELRGKEAEAWNQGLLAESCANPPPGLKDLIARAMVAAFPEKAAKNANLAGRMDSAFADSARFYRLTDPAKTKTESLDAPAPLNRRYLSVVYPIRLSRDATPDFLNTSREPWHYPYTPSPTDNPENQKPGPGADTRSFPDIYADALKAATNALLPHNLETGAFHPEALAQ